MERPQVLVAKLGPTRYHTGRKPPTAPPVSSLQRFAHEILSGTITRTCQHQELTPSMGNGGFDLGNWAKLYPKRSGEFTLGQALRDPHCRRFRLYCKGCGESHAAAVAPFAIRRGIDAG